jgi:hypothetical protein
MTSFHHQPEVAAPKIFSYPQAAGRLPHLMVPARIAAIAYQNKAAIYDLLFKASSKIMLTIAADPKRPAPGEFHVGTPRLGLHDDVRPA